MSKIKLALFASGTGSNVLNIINYFSSNQEIEVDCVISNNAEAGALNHGLEAEIDTFLFAKSELEDGEVVALLKERGVDLVVLAGFLLKIPAHLVESYPNKIINIHPALLPSYGGKGMYGMNVHNAVISNKDSKSGITIHLVNEFYDEGAILEQHTVELVEDESTESLVKKIHVLEQAHFPKAIETYILNLNN
ncbi:MAG: phosphoribosylglycinamide formyltransferase-1 [Urechidicola sp.]|jgi:phosphoribosylglycinamide formyltransferase-1